MADDAQKPTTFTPVAPEGKTGPATFQPVDAAPAPERKLTLAEKYGDAEACPTPAPGRKKACPEFCPSCGKHSKFFKKCPHCGADTVRRVREVTLVYFAVLLIVLGGLCLYAASSASGLFSVILGHRASNPWRTFSSKISSTVLPAGTSYLGK